MAVTTLDKSKDYSVVFPPEGKTEQSTSQAHFYQSGFYFDQHGAIVEEMLSDTDKRRLARMEAIAEGDRLAQIAKRESLIAAGLMGAELEEAAKPAPAPTLTETNSSSEIDLLEWARGKKKYVFGKVIKAAQDKYSYTPTDANSLVEFMIDNKFIALEEVNR